MYSKENTTFLYLGSSELSSRLFEYLINEGFKFKALVCQPDKPSKRGNKLHECATKIVAKKYGIPIYDPAKLRLEHSFVNEFEVDVLLCFAYGQIIPNEVLNFPKLECFNIHPSLLPKYRGASPIFEQLKNGDEKCGVTLMKMIDKLDAGRIFDVKNLNVSKEMYLEEFEEKILEAAKNLCEVSLFKVLNKEIEGVGQIEENATFCSKVSNEIEHIDLSENINIIFNVARAIGEKVGSYVVDENGKRIKFKKLNFCNLIHNPNELFFINKKLYFSNFKGECLEVCKIQLEGKNVVDAASFLNGYSSKLPLKIF